MRDYLIKCQAMAMFASIRDIRDKEMWQLRKLQAMRINGLTIGQLNPYFISVDSLTLFPVTAYLPKERARVLSKLQHIIDTVSEKEMSEYRNRLRSLG